MWKYGRSTDAYKKFKELYGVIDYIDYLVDDLIKTNERILNSTWERKKQYELTYKKTKELIQALSIDETVKKEQPELIRYSSQLLEDFSKKQSEENIIDSFELIVMPMQDYIYTKAKLHPKVTELYFLTQTLSEEYNGIELSAKHNSKDYSYFSSELEKSASALLKQSDQLRSDFGNETE